MSQAQWVKLHLVPQTDNTDMPVYVVGLLHSEAPNYYILNPMLETQQKTNSDELEYTQVGMNFINKAYVWRCQILEEKPEVVSEELNYSEGIGGGLG